MDGLDRNLKWRTIAITTGEEPLTDSNHHAGAKNRVLDIYGKPFEQEEQARNIYKVTKHQYGTMGPLFIEKLIKEYSQNGYKELSEEYEEIEKILTDRCSKDVVSSYLQAVTSVVLADSLIGRYFFNADLKSSVNMGVEILEGLQKEDETSDVNRAYEIICSWLMSNDLRFDRHDIKYEYDNIEDKRKDLELLRRTENDVSEKYGLYDKGYYYILPNKFNQLMEQNELSSLAVKKQLAELGHIKIEKDKNRTYYEVQKFYNGGKRRMIAFKLENEAILPVEEIEKLDEGESLYPNMGNEDLDVD